MMRYLFTDKWNSFWHFVFGILSLFFPIIAPIFMMYQAYQGTPNSVVDVLEFLIGLVLAFVLVKIYKRQKK